MKTAIGIIVPILLVALGVFLLGNTKPAPDTDNGARTGTLPAVALADSDGNPTTIRDFEDGTHALVINSWATWCPFCVEELPDLALLQSEFEGDIRVIAINRREERTKGVAYLAGLGVQSGMTYLYDSGDGWYRGIGGFTMPETLFVNAEGEVIVHKRGFMRIEEMREHVETTLASVASDI